MNIVCMMSYIAAMDFEALDAVCKDIFGKIWQLAAERS